MTVLRQAPRRSGVRWGSTSARGPAPEVALSILAEIVQVQASVQKRTPVPAAVAPTNAVDPVCGMSVNMSGARHTAEVEGVAYYFCCANCRVTFLRDPQAYQARP